MSTMGIWALSFSFLFFHFLFCRYLPLAPPAVKIYQSTPPEYFEKLRPPTRREGKNKNTKKGRDCKKTVKTNTLGNCTLFFVFVPPLCAGWAEGEKEKNRKKRKNDKNGKTRKKQEKTETTRETGQAQTTAQLNQKPSHGLQN